MGHELGNRKRFDNVIVGPDGEPAHPLAFLAARGQHDHGQASCRLPRAHPAADFKSGDAGQHLIENDEVGVRFAEPDFGFVAALDPVL
jgi:hypothetical protein